MAKFCFVVTGRFLQSVESKLYIEKCKKLNQKKQKKVTINRIEHLFYSHSPSVHSKIWWRFSFAVCSHTNQLTSFYCCSANRIEIDRISVDIIYRTRFYHKFFSVDPFHDSFFFFFLLSVANSYKFTSPMVRSWWCSERNSSGSARFAFGVEGNAFVARCTVIVSPTSTAVAVKFSANKFIRAAIVWNLFSEMGSDDR